jgi:hypothetical protein
MFRLYLIRSAAPPRPERRSAKVISLEVRRQALKDLQRPPAPDRPRPA